MQLYWPILLAVFADVFYQISAKSLPENLNPFASLTVTYLIGAVVSAALYFVTDAKPDLAAQMKQLNWTTVVLGFAIVGLEAGSIYMYKAGWNLNTGYMVKSILLAISLILVGFLLYREQISFSKIAGVAVCLIGLYLINR